MFGAVYLALIPLIAYFSGNKDSIKVLTILVGMILADLFITDYLKWGLDNFFLFRAVSDFVVLCIVYKFRLMHIKKLTTCIAIFVSLLINIYLCFELGNVFLYRHWETINLILCEVIFFTLIISDRNWNMLNNIKLYIYGAIAAVGLFLVGMLKYLSAKNDKLKDEVKVAENNIIILEKVQDDRKELHKSLAQAKKEAEEVQHENNEKRTKKVRPDVGTSFGDKRLK